MVSGNGTKLTDVKLLVLPTFGYGLLGREHFGRAFKVVSRRLRLDFLIHHVMVVVT